MEGQFKTAFLSVLLIGFLLVGLLARREELLLLAIPVAVHLAVGLALASDTGKVQLVATKTMSRSLIRENDTTEVQVEVENRGQGLEMVEIDDLLPNGLTLEDGFSRALDSMDHKGDLTLTYTVRARRGLYSLSTVRVRVGDLLGYRVWEGEVPSPATLTVLPHYEELSGVQIRTPRTLIHFGSIRSRRAGEGIEFFGTREYVPGDNLRRLDWKAYARLGRLVVNEYAAERASHVTVVLDARELVNRYRGEESLFDYSVRAAAAVSHYFLKNGNRVGLLIYGTYLDWLFLGYGHRHDGCIMRALARARTGNSQFFEELRYLPTRLFPAGSQLIVISPLIPGDEEILCLLQIKGYRVLVISPNTLSFEIKGLEDTPEVRLAKRILSLKRTSMFRLLLAAGVRWLEWDVRSPLAPQLKTISRRVR